MPEAMKMELILLAAIFFAMPVVVNTDVNVIVARPFELVHFECGAKGDFLVWLVNTAALTNATKEEQKIIIEDTSSNDTQYSVLTITALPENDGTDIGCIVGFAPHLVTFFDEKRLEVRGVSAVENVTLNFTLNNFLLISWSPPAYHSNDVSREDLNYEVSIINEKGIITLNTFNVTHCEVFNITRCDSFNASIKALLGPYKSIESVKGNKGSYSIAAENICPKKQVVFKLDYSPENCPSWLSISNQTSVVNESTNRTTEFVEYMLFPFRHYELTVSVRNLREEIEFKFDFNISTYNVQSLSINQYSNGSIGIKCLYCQPKAAGVGCHVILNDTVQESVVKFDIMTTDEKLVYTQISGNYTVTVYDLVSGSLIGPALEPSEVEVNLPSPTSPSPTQPKGTEPILVIVFATIGAVVAVVAVVMIIVLVLFCIVYLWRNKLKVLKKCHESAKKCKERAKKSN